VSTLPVGLARAGTPAAPVRTGVVVLAGVALLHVTLGRAGVGLGDVLDVVTGAAPDDVVAVVQASRLPRLLAGVVVGAALAVSGVLLQAVTRNPLAEPATTGIAAGAHLALVIATLVGIPGGLLPQGGMAVLGGLLAGGVVLLAASGGEVSPTRLVLAGVAVSLALSSVTAALLLVNEQQLTGLFLWGHGSLVQSGLERVEAFGPVLAVLVVAAWAMGRRLDVLGLGDAAAGALGASPAKTRLAATGLAVVLASGAVAIAGPIGFVGLAAPHLVRRFGGRTHRRLVGATAIWGGVLVLAADAAAQLLRPDTTSTELPTGVVTALLGAPLLVVIARSLAAGGGAGATGLAIRLRVPGWLVAVAIPLVLVGVAVTGLVVGDLPVSPGDAVAAVLGGGEDLTRSVVVDLRLPRVLVAALAGACLASSGAVLQTVTRNPLADPGVLGVTAGAGVGALVVLLAVPAGPTLLLPLGAFVGGGLVMALAVAAAWRGGLAPDRLALVGIGMAATGAALIDLLVVRHPGQATQALNWLAGSTYGRGIDDVALLTWAPVVLIPLLVLAGRHLDLLGVGDDGARTLGLSVQRTRLVAVVLACALAAAAVGIVGDLGFVGLLGPHLARPLTGPGHRRFLPVAAALGALVVVVADVVGRSLFAPTEIPAGLVVSLVGTPFFLFLIWRTRSAAA
jgi:iron complex transport system permease protein